MGIVDTHCHIHEIAADSGQSDGVHQRWLKAGITDPDAVIRRAATAGVRQLVCVGTDAADSAKAVAFVQSRPDCWATIGIHPHETARYTDGSAELQDFAKLAVEPRVVAVGESGLDYYYGHSSRDDQLRLLRFQMGLALEHDLPMVFHVREAFDDFWPVYDEYAGIKGVIHSFTADMRALDRALERGLYIGLNGIVTFMKDEGQLAAAKAVPLEKILLETDAPFLTPAPERGKICEPKHAATTLSFVAQLQGRTDEQLAQASTANARRLFDLPG